MSEDIREKLKCPEIEDLRSFYLSAYIRHNTWQTSIPVSVPQAQAIVQAFDQRNEEIIRRMNEMQSWIDAGQAAAEIEHARQHVTDQIGNQPNPISSTTASTVSSGIGSPLPDSSILIA
jgi:hypothetical protein